MKKLILSLLLLGIGTLAKAHPKPDYPAYYVPTGSTFTTTDDINIIPNERYVTFDANKIYGPLDPQPADDHLYCSIRVSTLSTQDRYIPKGRTYKVTKVSNDEFYAPTVLLFFYVDDKSIDYILCNSQLSKPLTIAALKDTVKSVFQLELAPPVRLP